MEAVSAIAVVDKRGRGAIESGMQSGQPSRTALGAAVLRAAHQVLDHAAIFTDPLALRILGPGAEAMIRDAASDLAQQRLRWFIAVRSRIAEDALAQARLRG